MACIYRIFNTVNDKSYIGQTQQPLEVRWAKHKRKALKKLKGSVFQKALLEIGFDNFFIESIYQVNPFEVDFDITDKRALQEHLNKKEQFYIQKYNSLEEGYNSTKGGTGYNEKSLTKEERKSLQNQKKNERRRNRKATNPEYLKRVQEKHRKYIQAHREKPEIKQRRRDRYQARKEYISARNKESYKMKKNKRHLNENSK